MDFTVIVFWLISGAVNIFLSIPFLRTSPVDTDEFDKLTPHYQKKAKGCAFRSIFFCVLSLALWIFVYIMLLALFLTKRISVFPKLCAAYCPLIIFTWSVSMAESVKSKYYISLWKAGKKTLADTQAPWRSLSHDGFAADSGVVLGQKNSARLAGEGQFGQPSATRKPSRLLRFTDGYNTLAVGPARCGKTIGIAVPTALSWQGNLIAYDPAGEIAEGSAIERCKISNVYIITPSGPNAAKYNPLMDIPDGPAVDRFARSIVSVFFSLKDEDAFFGCVPARVFAAALVHVALSGKYRVHSRNLVYVARLVDRQRASGWKELISEMLAARHVNSQGELFPDADSFIRQCVGEVGSIDREAVETAAEYLHFCIRPLLNRELSNMLSGSSVSVRDFFCHDKKTTVYIGHAGADRKNHRDAVMVFTMYASVLAALMRENSGAMDPRTLFLLDDFQSLGRIPEFAATMNALQFKRASFLILAQSVPQIDNVYGEETRRRVVDECDIVASFAPSDAQTAKTVIELLDERNIRNLRHSFGQENIMMIPADSVLVIRKGARHYMAKRVLWFDDPRFRDSWRLSKAHRLEDVQQ